MLRSKQGKMVIRLAWTLLLLVGGTAMGESYTVIDLNQGGAFAEAHAINDQGHIAGTINDPVTFTMYAFLYKNGVLNALVPLGGSSLAGTGHGLNNLDQVVGFSNNARLNLEATLWGIGAPTDLGNLPGGDYGNGYGINDKGEVAGYGLRSDASVSGHVRAFHWKDGIMTDLGTLGGNSGTAWGLNNKGQIVGVSMDTSGVSKPTLWDHGSIVCLCNDEPDMAGGIAYAINESGQIVGNCMDFLDPNTLTDEHRHAVVWQNGSMLEIGALGGELSDAWGNNEAGDVVGWAETAPGIRHAFLWRNGTMVDLNSLLPAGSGWELTFAYDINNLGQIVGLGMFGGKQHGFLLNPSVAHKKSRADFNADGKEDILLRNPSSGTVELWLMK